MCVSSAFDEYLLKSLAAQYPTDGAVNARILTFADLSLEVNTGGPEVFKVDESSGC
jgi:hypothetical protein